MARKTKGTKKLVRMFPRLEEAMQKSEYKKQVIWRTLVGNWYYISRSNPDIQGPDSVEYEMMKIVSFEKNYAVLEAQTGAKESFLYVDLYNRLMRVVEG